MYFLARITHEGNATLADFPDCPGCQTFARPPHTIATQAGEALAGWIEATLDSGDTIPRPSLTIRLGSREQSLAIDVDPTLAARITMRWARDDAHLSQAQIAERMGVSPQAVSRVERNAGAASVATLSKYAAALGGKLELRIEPARVLERPAKQYRARAAKKR